MILMAVGGGSKWLHPLAVLLPPPPTSCPTMRILPPRGRNCHHPWQVLGAARMKERHDWAISVSVNTANMTALSPPSHLLQEASCLERASHIAPLTRGCEE